MTRKRRQVLAHLIDCALNGEKVVKRRAARECGLYGHADLKRVLRDLKEIARAI